MLCGAREAWTCKVCRAHTNYKRGWQHPRPLLEPHPHFFWRKGRIKVSTSAMALAEASTQSGGWHLAMLSRTLGDPFTTSAMIVEINLTDTAFG
jgi:hypothetical protein